MSAYSEGRSLPSVLIISLNKEPWFDDMYADLLSALKARASVTETTNSAEAIQSHFRHRPFRNSHHYGGLRRTQTPITSRQSR